MDVNMGQTIYRGPAVLSSFTGCNTDDCAEEVMKIDKSFKVKGVYPDTLMKAGNAMGLEFQENMAFQGRSLFWAGTVMVKMPPSIYLVTIPKHYIALEVRDGNLYICDNHTKQELELSNSSRLSQKIERVWKVIKVRPYHKPHIVKTEYAAERNGMDISIRKIDTLSDEGIKIHHLGSFKAASPSAIQDIAFALMELKDK